MPVCSRRARNFAPAHRIWAEKRDPYGVDLNFIAPFAGKGGVIKHVMSGVNPQGCQVFSYRHPSATELQHDFLWRTTRDLPDRGRIGIFNRSYYEEVLIVRAHPEILRSEGIADRVLDENAVWQSRFHSILGVGKASAPKRHPDREILSPHIEGRAAQTLSSAHR